jgi:hypothetical protein
MATRTELPKGTTEMSEAHAMKLQNHKAAVAPTKRKTTPKKVEGEGILASLCTLLCDHQLGMCALVRVPSHVPATNSSDRHLCKPLMPPLLHTHHLPSRAESDLQVFPNVLLQPRNEHVWLWH